MGRAAFSQAFNIAHLRLIALVLALAFVSSALADTPYFKGKTITILVGYTAGGPVDNFARVIGARLAAHVPGNPSVIIQNMPGADGVVAANYLANLAPQDGTMILVEIAPFTNQYIGAQGAKFDAAKFLWLGALNYSNVIYLRGDLGAHSPDDLAAIKGPIVIGGLAPNASRDLYMKTYLDSIGVNRYIYVPGYPGTLDIRNALLRGEVNFSTEAAVAIKTDLASYIKTGAIVPIVQSGLNQAGRYIRDPQVSDLPTAQESVAKLAGPQARNRLSYRAMSLVIQMFSAGRALLLPPKANPTAVRVLRTALAELNNDSEFQKSAANLNGGAPVMLTDGQSSQDIASKITEAVSADTEALRFLDKMAESAN